MNTTATTPVRKRRWWIAGVAAVAVIGVIIAGVFLGPSLFGSDKSSPEENGIDPDLAQCRVDAIVAYMSEEGFSDGDYVIGEENVNVKAPGLLETGSAAFGDEPVVTRSDLQAVFESEDPDLQQATQAQLNKFPEFDRSVVLDTDNWEIVQMTIPVQIDGNTGIVGGAVVKMGTRNSEAGEAGWIFVNPDTCLVQRANFTATGEAVPEGTPESDKPIGFIRPGCTNPGDGFRPPPQEQCPPGNTIPECAPKEPTIGQTGGPHGPGEFTGDEPPQVEAETTNPNGVTDSASQPLGSETGGQAPGATEPAPRDVPPPAGGGNVNSGDNGGDDDPSGNTDEIDNPL